MTAPEPAKGVSPAPNDTSGKLERRPFDMDRVIETAFEIDHQPVLYVLESFEQLRDAMNSYAGAACSTRRASRLRDPR
ncbi:MAG: hypothetical protein R3B49_10500 [Phycisphaerales bacterium]